MIPKIILGTANFGSPYGVANGGRSLALEDSKLITRWTQVNGSNHFDTALAYGDAEKILGTSLDQTLNPIVDTKLDTKSCQSRKSILQATEKARDKLGVELISTLYLHDESLLQTASATEVTAGLREVLNVGLAKQIGVSAYSEAAVIACKKALPELSVFQVPENICDRRLFDSRHIQALAGDGNEFLVRSIFLQGLLLMDPGLLPPNLESAAPGLRSLMNYSHNNSVTVMDLCLGYAFSIPWASGIIVGVASLGQLQEIYNSATSLPVGWDSAIAKLPSEIIDPRNWAK